MMSNYTRVNKHLREKTILYSKKQAFYASVAISLLLNILIFMGLLFGRSRFVNIDWSGYISFFFWHLGSNIILFYLLFLFNFRAIKKKKRERNRSLYVLFGTIAICLIASPILSEIQWFFLKGDTNFGNFATFNLVKDLIVGIIVILFSYIMYLYEKREQTILTNQKLMRENIRVKYESLKNQLDPHFLFNSLNTLNGLVGVDDNKAHDYIDNLSSVFRFTLHSKNFCSVGQEMEFVNAYFSLLKIRYGESLVLHNHINTAYNDYFIIPVSLQLLVENAVKHNVVSSTDPLCIVFESSSDDFITVRNRINPKVNASAGGIGLANLTERYSMLFNETVIIKEINGEFTVTIPLIKELPI